MPLGISLRRMKKEQMLRATQNVIISIFGIFDKELTIETLQSNHYQLDYISD